MRNNVKKHIRIVNITYYLFLIVFLAAAVLFRNNIDVFYAKIGDFYFKQNNIQKAQYFYEKSFAAGNENTQTRDIYVNSIINSPLTTESQEKLLHITEGTIQDSASIKAETFLSDLMHEIHKKYPENYIAQASFNRKIIHWDNLPITYSFKNIENFSNIHISAIENAFDEWDKASSHKVIFSRVNSGDANIIIEAIQNKKEDIEYGKKYIIAYTTPIINNNVLERMEIKICTKRPDGKTYTQNQMYNTVLHEIFHALGYMGHSTNPDNIMYMSKNNLINEQDEKQTLNQADINTLELLYSTKPDITNKGNLSYKYIPFLVLGGDIDKNISKAREAKIYISKAPTLPNGYIDLAETYVGDKKYAQAIKSLEKALSLSDTDDAKYIVYYNLAVSYYYIGHYDMALDYLNYAKNIADKDELKLLTAEIYLKQDKIPEAINAYSELVKKYPHNIEYTISLANIYVKKHDYIKARKTLKTYIKNNPNDKNNTRFKPYKILML